jgi:hypothetical protein
MSSILVVVGLFYSTESSNSAAGFGLTNIGPTGRVGLLLGFGPVSQFVGFSIKKLFSEFKRSSTKRNPTKRFL